MAHTLTDREANDLIAIGVTPRELVRLGFPNADDEFADFLLWEKTPYPMVSGVHDVTDSIADLVDRGNRCDALLADHMCGNRVPVWGAHCWRHKGRA